MLMKARRQGIIIETNGSYRNILKKKKDRRGRWRRRMEANGCLCTSEAFAVSTALFETYASVVA